MEISIQTLKIWKKELEKVFEFVIRNCALFLLSAYRTIGTNQLGGCCRFEPSCSEYAVKCFSKHNSLKALHLVIIRLLKCRPGGKFGIDPVPERVDL